MSKRILLTGAAGFIGFHTAKVLLERGDEVIGMNNLNDYYDHRLKLSRPEILNKNSKYRNYACLLNQVLLQNLRQLVYQYHL